MEVDKLLQPGLFLCIPAWIGCNIIFADVRVCVRMRFSLDCTFANSETCQPVYIIGRAVSILWAAWAVAPDFGNHFHRYDTEESANLVTLLYILLHWNSEERELGYSLLFLSLSLLGVNIEGKWRMIWGAFSFILYFLLRVCHPYTYYNMPLHSVSAIKLRILFVNSLFTHTHLPYPTQRTLCSLDSRTKKERVPGRQKGQIGQILHYISAKMIT